MKIGIGHRRLVVEMITAPTQTTADLYPSALGASDHELARLTTMRDAIQDRQRWEADSVFYGKGRLG